jgi:hypothetical protein
MSCRLVALSLADHDRAGQLGVIHGFAHRLDGGGIGTFAVAAPHEAGSGDRPGLGGAQRLGDDQLVDSGGGRHRSSA